MSHPEFIEIDGKKVSTLDVMLMPCKTKKDLQNWIRTFLGLDMPDCIVCEESSASPMDMLWNVYRASLEGDFAESSQLYFASRGSFKTLGAAVLEIVILLHQRKTVSHMAAILRQSKKCYDYFQYFFRKDVLNKVAFDKKTMERTELKLDSPYGVQPFIQILPCTMQGANCIAKNTGIVLANGLICTAQNILPGDFIKTFDYRKGIEVPVLVGSVSQTKKFARELVFNDGSNLIASEDHQIFTQKGWITVSNLRLGDDVVSPDGNTYTTYMNGETVCGSPLPSFQQFLLGTLLGDSSLKWPSKLEDGSQKNGGNYGVGPRFSCNHGADQYEYLLYKKEILESNGFRVKLIKDSKDQHKIYTNVSDNLCWAYNLLYPESNGRKKTITKKLLQLLDVEALAFWFMDDARGNQKIIGTSKDHAFQLATCGFSHEENGIICEWFRQRWGLDCDVGSITSQYGHYDVIEFSLDSSRRLSEMISPFVHTQLRYKLLPPKSHMFRRCITCGKKIHEKIEYGFKSCCVKRHSTRIGRNYLVGIRDHFNRRVVKINQLPQMELIDLHIDTEDEHLRSFLGNGILIHNSEHSNFLTFDEVDVVENVKAYNEAKMIPVETPDRKPPITLYISTRKSAFGLVQNEVDNAQKTGVKIRSWNIIDVTQACPPEKSRLAEGPVQVFYSVENLMVLTGEEYDKLGDIEKTNYEMKSVYKGCLGCPIAPLCLGRLATKQKCNSPMLKSHNEVTRLFRELETGDALAQLMCLKPSTHGLVFTTFDQRQSVMTPTKMWEKFMGETAKDIITKDELIEAFKRYNVPCYCGIDWGWESPAVAIFMYIDKSENVYIIQEFAITHTDDAEFIDILKRRYHSKFNVQMYYPDVENPSGINLMKKADLPVKSKGMDKSIHPGIQTIKRFMRVPGTYSSKLYILDDCKGLILEIGKYHLKLDVAGQIVSYDEYADDFNHHIDALRYPIHNRLGKIPSQIATGEITLQKPIQNAEGNFIKVPSAVEYAQQMGIVFNDNRELVEKQQRKEKLGDKVVDDGHGTDGKSGGDPGGSGFSWSF